VKRFQREARAAVKIKSEHVARIIDVGTLDEGAPFIVMEHLHGEDLAARLVRTGPMPVEEAVDFLMQACEAIAEAHGLGIVHRDLKPANLYCVRGSDGQATIKVLDFGISKVMDAAGLHAPGEMTKTSVVVGSPFYMSPEQMQAPRTVDARTDIWSIGVILYELLAGNVPFFGETLPQIAVHVAKSPAPSLRELRSDIPPGLESVIERCLEKNPKKRYKSVAELAAALGRFGPRKALSSVDRIRLTFKNASERPFSISLPPEGDVGQQVAAGTSPSWAGAATTRTFDMRSRRGLVAAVGGAVALAALLGVWWTRGATPVSVAAAPSGLVGPPARGANAAQLALQGPTTGGSKQQPGDLSNDDPTRAYPVDPSAPVIALPPPTGTGLKAMPPRWRAAVDPRHLKTATRPGSDGESDSASAAPRSAPKGEGTCLLHLNSTPPATVVLDNIAIGTSPKLSISVFAGTHSVVFRSADGQVKRSSVVCAPGETKTVDIKLRDTPTAQGASSADPAPCPLCERP
jgi:serine/threonine-protein kinase